MNLRVPWGTVLNTATVAIGATLGLLIGKRLPLDYQNLALAGLGLVTVGMGIKLFLGSRNILIVAMSVALGGMVGLALGIQAGIETFADWARDVFGAQGPNRFSEGLITASILFCVGPMTILGCIQDGLERKIELLALKSTMDGIAALFFAATMGFGVLVSAIVVLVYQGALTLMAGTLRPLANDEEMLAELSAAGGAILLGIGIGLLDIRTLPTANFLPALVLAPVFVLVFRRLPRRKSTQPDTIEAPADAPERGPEVLASDR